MPRIRYELVHTLDGEEARRRLELLMARFAKKYGFSTRWERAGWARVSGRGVKGSLELAEGHVVVDLDLSLLLSPLRQRIQRGIATQIEQALLGSPKS